MNKTLFLLLVFCFFNQAIYSSAQKKTASELLNTYKIEFNDDAIHLKKAIERGTYIKLTFNYAANKITACKTTVNQNGDKQEPIPCDPPPLLAARLLTLQKHLKLSYKAKTNTVHIFKLDSDGLFTKIH